MAADAPEDAYSPSDDELDELVGQATGEDEEGSTEAPDDEPQPTVAERDSESDEIEASAETEEGVEGEAEPEDAPSPGEEPEPEPAEEAEQQTSKPFQFKASGALHTFEGATEMADGSARLSKVGTENFRGLLSSYVELTRTTKERTRDLQRQLERATKDRTDKDIESEAVVTLFQDIEKMSPEDRWAWAESFAARKDQLQLAVERQKLERDRATLQRERGGPVLSEEESAEVRQQATATEVNATFEKLLKNPTAKFLTEGDRKALRDKWLAKGSKLVVRVEKDDPVTGAKKGDYVFDDADIVEDWMDRVQMRKEATALQGIAKKNAAMNSDQNGRQPPPAIRGGKAPAPGGKQAPTAYKGAKGRKQWKKDFLAGKLDREA